MYTPPHPQNTLISLIRNEQFRNKHNSNTLFYWNRVNHIWAQHTASWRTTGMEGCTLFCSSPSSTACGKGEYCPFTYNIWFQYVMNISDASAYCVLLKTHGMSMAPICFSHYLYRKPYRSLALLWAGSMVATQIVFIPSITIGETNEPFQIYSGIAV